MRIEGKDGKKKKNKIKDTKCLENTSKTQKISGFINSIWCFEIAFPLKLSEHFAFQSLQVSINVLAMKLQLNLNISM